LLFQLEYIAQYECTK